MVKVLIIADDLTGALDTSVHFAAAGLRTQVLVSAQRFLHPDGESADADVVAVNTNTRHLPAGEAFRIVYDIARQANVMGIPWIYKKTDSALRGNTGAELCAMKSALGLPSLPFIPAYPRMGRTVRGGILHINGVPASQTAMGADPLNPLKTSCVAEILMQSGYEKEAAGIEIFDAQTQEDLLAIREKLGDKVRFCGGSGGFAEILASFLSEADGAFGSAGSKPNAVNDMSGGPAGCRALLLVCGSVHENAYAQVRYAEEMGVPVHILPQPGREEPGDDMSGGLCERLTEGLHKSGLCILVTSDYRKKASPAPHLENSNLQPAAHRAVIEKETAAIVRRLAETGEADGLCVFGGDTLLNCMDALGIHALTVCAQPVPGVVRAAAVYRGRLLPVLSKAGSFGSPDVIKVIRTSL